MARDRPCRGQAIPAAAVLRHLAAAHDRAGGGTAGDAALPLVLHQGADTSLTAQDTPVDGDVVLVVGPEGGVTDDELAVFDAAGARVVRLGPSVLRSSTAGAVAASVILSRTRRWT